MAKPSRLPRELIATLAERNQPTQGDAPASNPILIPPSLTTPKQHPLPLALRDYSLDDIREVAKRIDISDECDCPLETVCFAKCGKRGFPELLPDDPPHPDEGKRGGPTRCPGVETCIHCVSRAPRCHHVEQAARAYIEELDDGFLSDDWHDIVAAGETFYTILVLGSADAVEEFGKRDIVPDTEDPLIRGRLIGSQHARIACYSLREKKGYHLYHPDDRFAEDGLVVNADDGAGSLSKQAAGGPTADYQPATDPDDEDRWQQGPLYDLARKAVENSQRDAIARAKQAGKPIEDTACPPLPRTPPLPSPLSRTGTA